jgi:hypothetical protein
MIERFFTQSKDWIKNFCRNHKQFFEILGFIGGVIIFSAMIYGEFFRDPSGQWAAWELAETSGNYEAYLEAYPAGDKYKSAVIEVLKKRNVSINVRQNYKNLKYLWLFTFELPIHELLRETSFKYELRNILINAEFSGEGIDATYRGGGIYTTGTKLSGSIIFVAPNGDNQETVKVNYLSEPSESVKSFSWGHARDKLRRVLNDEVKPAVENLAKKWIATQKNSENP